MSENCIKYAENWKLHIASSRFSFSFSSKKLSESSWKITQLVRWSSENKISNSWHISLWFITEYWPIKCNLETSLATIPLIHLYDMINSLIVCIFVTSIVCICVHSYAYTWLTLNFTLHRISSRLALISQLPINTRVPTWCIQRAYHGKGVIFSTYTWDYN